MSAPRAAIELVLSFAFMFSFSHKSNKKANDETLAILIAGYECE